MDANRIVDGLIMYVGLIVLLTFHEFGHAWTALKCGDDTAKLQGRVSLNPLVHIDLIGTVAIPLIMIFFPLGFGLVGWAKPVPVNPTNLRNPRVDDILVTLAGPVMNLLLAVVLVGLARVGYSFYGGANAVAVCLGMAKLSLLLCFFNLLPIPPLDGSQIVRVLLGMSYEAYHQFARFGFIALLIVINVPFVQKSLSLVTNQSLLALARLSGLPL